MKICVFGNQDNAGYRFCKWLRDAGHDAHLYMMERFESPRSLPEAIDRSLAENGYPAWIHGVRNTPVNTVFGGLQVFQEIDRNFDVALVIGSMAMMNAHHLRIPLVNVSTGPSNQGIIRMWDHVSLKHRLFWTTVRYFVRKSVRKCRKILVHYDPEIYSLGVQQALDKIVFYGMPEDVAGNAERVDRQLLAELDAQYASHDRVFIWLGRIAFSDPGNPMYKGTDKFLAAAARLIREQRHRVRLIIGKHGEDYPALARMAEDLGIAGHVDWVDHMPYWKLLTYLSMRNSVVFDELTPLHCVSTGMFRETLSVGGVLVRSFSPVLTRAGHGGGDCPVLHAESADEVHARMLEVLSWSPEEYQQRRERAMQWARDHLDYRTQISRLVHLLEEVVYADQTATRLRPLYQ